MRILNAIFGRRKGSTERYFIDYIKCLGSVGCDMATLTYAKDPILEQISESITNYTIKNYGQWDPALSWKIKNIIKSMDVAPDVIVVYGVKAYELFDKINSTIPLIALCNNDKVKNFIGNRNIIASGEAIRDLIIKSGHPEKKVINVPSMVYVPKGIKFEKNNFKNKIPKIGVIGRFNAKNGFMTFISSLSILRNRGIKFTASIAGMGAELEKLNKLAVDLLVDDVVTFEGWVDDRFEFLNSIDILCLPNLRGFNSQFLLEAFSCSLPVIATNIQGHSDVGVNNKNAVMVTAGEPGALAIGMEQIIRDSEFANKIAKSGFDMVIKDYNSEIVGKQLSMVIKKIISSLN